MRKINISEPSLGVDEWNALREPLETGWLTSGPKVRLFETEFASIHEVKHAVAVTSATTALHLALVALKVQPGDEVIVPAFTWISTANVVEYCGATPVFVDIDIQTFNIDLKRLAEKVNGRTKVIIAVSLFGLAIDVHEIRKVAPGIAIVEDAACAAGARSPSGMAGSVADVSCFSFHPRKSITTGEGGMVTTQNDLLAEELMMLRNHGASISEEQRHQGMQPFILPDFNVLGYNYRMTDLQGAVGVIQLSKLTEFITERNHWAKFYQKELESIEWLSCPTVPSGFIHGWQSFVCIVDEARAGRSRNSIMGQLQQSGIATRPGTHAVHMLGYYSKKYGINQNDYPIALLANNTTMAIPLHNKMSPEDYCYVVEQLRNIV